MNEPIGNRVKGLNPKLGQVTPHHLLSNSAGMRDFAAPVISNDDAALGNMVRGWKDDVFFADQGEIYSYSSAGFWLSGFVVEELYGKPYADAMTELSVQTAGNGANHTATVHGDHLSIRDGPRGRRRKADDHPADVQ